MDFIKDPVLRKFYMVDLENLLVDYLPGRPEMKPDVIQQTLELEKERAKMAEEEAKHGGQIILQEPGKEPVALTNPQIVEIIQKQQNDIKMRDKQILEMTEEIKRFHFEMHELRKDVEKLREDNSDSEYNKDSGIKIVEVVNNNADLMKRYEDLLEENRNLKKMLDEVK
jgi:hypothetical protein